MTYEIYSNIKWMKFDIHWKYNLIFLQIHHIIFLVPFLKDSLTFFLHKLLYLRIHVNLILSNKGEK